MTTYLKSFVTVLAATVLFVPITAFAQKTGGGVVGEARLHPGTWNSQRSSQSRMRSQPMYRNSAPTVVRTERAPDAVAQVPTERRSFSYEPSQGTEPNTKEQTHSGTCGCSGTNRTIDRSSTNTEPATESRRSFSYEPSMSEPSTTTRSYAGPRTRSFNSPPRDRTSGTKAERNNQRN